MKKNEKRTKKNYDTTKPFTNYNIRVPKTIGNPFKNLYGLRGQLKNEAFAEAMQMYLDKYTPESLK